jgi:hypothetical protein
MSEGRGMPRILVNSSDLREDVPMPIPELEPKGLVTERHDTRERQSMSPGEKQAWLLNQALDVKRDILTMPLPDPNDDNSPPSTRQSNKPSACEQTCSHRPPPMTTWKSFSRNAASPPKRKSHAPDLLEHPGLERKQNTRGVDLVPTQIVIGVVIARVRLVDYPDHAIDRIHLCTRQHNESILWLADNGRSRRADMLVHRA